MGNHVLCKPMTDLVTRRLRVAAILQQLVSHKQNAVRLSAHCLGAQIRLASSEVLNRQCDEQRFAVRQSDCILEARVSAVVIVHTHSQSLSDSYLGDRYNTVQAVEYAFFSQDRLSQSAAMQRFGPFTRHRRRQQNSQRTGAHS
jgi:hypothetical protein